MAVTKIEKILNDRGLTQSDLRRLIQAKSGFLMGRDRVSKICTGRLTNYTAQTAKMIAEALDVKVDDIIEYENVKKTNIV